MASRKITELSHEQAKWYFRDEKNYVNFDLPPYFHFADLLTAASAALIGKDFYKDVCKKKASGKNSHPSHYEQVNYTVLNNKDGSFGWRPLQLIHPVLYVDLVNLITEENNWKIITDKFRDFARSRVECIGMPRISDDQSSHRASQVSHWWEEMEQRSIKLALKYSYVFVSDIANCYGSIYTHSIEWALAAGGRAEVKNFRVNPGSVKSVGAEIGGRIDAKIQSMNFGQTNGIPQGSTLMDFISEIVLGYADTLLTEVLEREIPSADYHILRYRDDYKIFVNSPVVGNVILKHLSLVLYELNMKMNLEKTYENNDIIMSSIKKEKLERITTAPTKQHYQKEALRIYQLSKKYPNAGLVTKELSEFYDRIISLSYLQNTDIEVLISIFCMIAVSSPRLANWVSAILSKLMSMVVEPSRRIELIKMVHNKFETIPNTTFIDIWLQRISAPLDLNIPYNATLTKLALGTMSNSEIWECGWLNDAAVHLLNGISVSDLRGRVETEQLSPVIPREEVELFKLDYD